MASDLFFHPDDVVPAPEFIPALVEPSDEPVSQMFMKLRAIYSIYNLWLNCPGMGLNNLDDSRDGIAKYLVRNPDTCFVAVEQGTIIGAILTGHDGRRGYTSHTAARYW